MCYDSLHNRPSKRKRGNSKTFHIKYVNPNTICWVMILRLISKPESVIPLLVQRRPVALLPASRPRTASLSPSDTCASCHNPVWSSWQSAGGGWPACTRLSPSFLRDHCDVWPRATQRPHCGCSLLTKHFFDSKQDYTGSAFCHHADFDSLRPLKHRLKMYV